MHVKQDSRCSQITCFECLTITGSRRQLIMFGDAAPHQFEDYVDIMSDPDFADVVTEQIDWRDEAEELARMVRALLDSK